MKGTVALARVKYEAAKKQDGEKTGWGLSTNSSILGDSWGERMGNLAEFLERRSRNWGTKDAKRRNESQVFSRLQNLLAKALAKGVGGWGCRVA